MTINGVPVFELLGAVIVLMAAYSIFTGALWRAVQRKMNRGKKDFFKVSRVDETVRAIQFFTTDEKADHIRQYGRVSQIAYGPKGSQMYDPEWRLELKQKYDLWKVVGELEALGGEWQ